MVSEKGSCSGKFTIGANNVLTAVSTLNFTRNVESLKSEHNAMDKNTYKAMKMDKYPNITFTASSVTVKQAGGANYTVLTEN
ncbi:MAG: YceI family protein [Sphingobacteriales bacterium]|nr:YceI family protein [Sphingobacteriales bacterium]